MEVLNPYSFNGIAAKVSPKSKLLEPGSKGIVREEGGPSISQEIIGD